MAEKEKKEKRGNVLSRLFLGKKKQAKPGLDLSAVKRGDGGAPPSRSPRSPRSIAASNALRGDRDQSAGSLGKALEGLDNIADSTTTAGSVRAKGEKAQENALDHLELASRRAEVEDLKTQLADANKRLDARTKEAERVQRKLNELEADLERAGGAAGGDNDGGQAGKWKKMVVELKEQLVEAEMKVSDAQATVARLEHDVEILRTKKADLQIELQKKKGECEKLRKRVDAAEKEAKKAKGERKNTAEKDKDKDKDTAALVAAESSQDLSAAPSLAMVPTEDFDKVVKEHRHADERARTVQAELESERAEREAVEKQVTKLEADLRVARQMQADAQEKLEASEFAKTRAEKSSESSSKQLGEAQAKITQFEVMFMKLEKQAKDGELFKQKEGKLVMQMGELKSTIAKMKDDKQKDERDRRAREQYFAEMRKVAQKDVEKLEETRRELTKYVKNCDVLQTQLDDANSGRTRDEAERSAAIAQTQERLETAETRVRHLEKELKESNERIAVLTPKERELDARIADVARLTDARDTLQSRLDNLDADYAKKMADEVADVKKREKVTNTELAKNLAKAQMEAEKATQERDATQAEMDKLRATVDGIKDAAKKEYERMCKKYEGELEIVRLQVQFSSGKGSSARPSSDAADAAGSSDGAVTTTAVAADGSAGGDATPTPVELQSWKDAYNNLETQFKDVGHAFEQLKREKEAAEKSAADAAKELNATLSSTRDKANQLELTRQELEARVSALTVELAQRTESLETTSKSLREANDERRSIDKEMAAVRAAASALEAELTEIRAAKKASESAVSETKEAMVQQNRELAEARRTEEARRKKLEGDIDTMQAELKTHAARIVELEKERDDAAKRADDAAAQLAAETEGDSKDDLRARIDTLESEAKAIEKQLKDTQGAVVKLEKQHADERQRIADEHESTMGDVVREKKKLEQELEYVHLRLQEESKMREAADKAACEAKEARESLKAELMSDASASDPSKELFKYKQLLKETDLNLEDVSTKYRILSEQNAVDQKRIKDMQMQVEDAEHAKAETVARAKKLQRKLEDLEEEAEAAQAEEAREQIDELTAQLEEVNRNLLRATKDAERSKQDCERYKRELEQYKAMTEEHEAELKSDMRVSQKKLQSEVEYLTMKLETETKHREKLEKQAKKDKKALADTQRKAQELDSAKTQAGQTAWKMQQDVSKLKSVEEEYEEKIAKLDRSVTKLTKELTETKIERDAALQQRDDLKKKNKKLAQELEDAQEELDAEDVEAKLAEIEAEANERIDELEEMLESKIREANAAREDARVLQTRDESNKETIAELEQRLNHAMKKMKMQTTNMEELNLRLDAELKAKQKLEKLRKQQQKEQKELQQRIHEGEMSKTQADNMVWKISEDVQKKDSQLREQEQLIEGLVNSEKRLQAQLDAAAEEQDDMRRERDRAVREQRRLQSELDELREDVDEQAEERAAELRELKAQLITAKDDGKTVLEAALRNKDRALADLRECEERAEKVKEALDAEISQMRDDMARSLRKKQSEIDELEARLQSAEKRIHKAERSARRNTNNAQQIKADLAEMDQLKTQAQNQAWKAQQDVESRVKETEDKLRSQITEREREVDELHSRMELVRAEQAEAEEKLRRAMRDNQALEQRLADFKEEADEEANEKMEDLKHRLNAQINEVKRNLELELETRRHKQEKEKKEMQHEIDELTSKKREEEDHRKALEREKRAMAQELSTTKTDLEFERQKRERLERDRKRLMKRAGGGGGGGGDDDDDNDDNDNNDSD